MNTTEVRTPRASKFKKMAARVAVLALVVGGAVALTAVSAGADSPSPVGGTQTGVVVMNGDGTITVTVSASWSWTNKNCADIVNAEAPNNIAGYQVAWGDNTANQLGTNDIFVGTASDNVVRMPATTCADDGSDSSGAFQDTISHTYAAGTPLDEIQPCVVTYDVHTDKIDPGDTGGHSLVAGGEDYNDDNSVDKNNFEGASGCEPVTFSPDVAIVKTGPASATVGTNFSYTLTASNAGLVEATDVIVTDVIPSNLTYVSATPEAGTCSYAAGTKTVTCDVGDLAVGESTTVTVTVTPTTAGVDIVNTACVAPDDATPNDNCSTSTIGGANVLAAVVSTQPKFTG